MIRVYSVQGAKPRGLRSDASQFKRGTNARLVFRGDYWNDSRAGFSFSRECTDRAKVTSIFSKSDACFEISKLVARGTPNRAAQRDEGCSPARNRETFDLYWEAITNVMYLSVVCFY